MQEPSDVVELLTTEANELLLPTEALSRSFVGLPSDADGTLRASASPSVSRRRGFRIGSVGLVPEQGALCEVIERPHIFPIPNTADCCLGLTNLRGMLIPSFKVHSLMGVEEGGDSGRWFIVVGKGSQAGALCIDGLPVPVELSPESRIAAIPPLPAPFHAQVIGGYQSQGELWFEFDYAGLFKAVSEH